MTPHFGAGAGQAIEVRAIIRQTIRTGSLCAKDAFLLGRLLAHPLTTLDDVPAALKAYQDVRLPFAQFIARESDRTGHMFDFAMPEYYDGTDKGNEEEELEILKEKILGQWNWESEGGPLVEWLEAERKLQESVGLCNAPCENDTTAL